MNGLARTVSVLATAIMATACSLLARPVGELMLAFDGQTTGWTR